MAIKKISRYFMLLAMGTVSLNIFLIQAPLPVTAVAPGTPTSTSLSTKIETPTNTGNPNPRQTLVSLTPTPQSYIVQAGENIYRIAQKVYGDSAKYTLILEANKLGEDAKLVAGTVLKIPYLAMPTPTIFRTATPSPTSTLDLPTATKIIGAASTQTTDPSFRDPISRVQPSSGDDPAIVALLTTFATTTLVGSSIISGVFAIWVYKNARRIANQQSMARRVRPPLRR